MDTGTQSPLCEELEAAFDWWRDAGVDCDFDDSPANWLKLAPQPDQPQPEAPPQVAAKVRSDPIAAVPAVIDTQSLPNDLATFAEWWLSAPELDAGRTSGRVPPRGEKHAELMVVVPEPERDDRDTLLSGPQGKLLANMLRAMQLEADQLYVASAIPRHLPGADWQALASGQTGAVLLHHIDLVSPKRLIAFGGNILPFFGNDLPQSSAVLRKINLEGKSIPMLATRSLPALLDRPRWKGDVWKAWLSWTQPAPLG